MDAVEVSEEGMIQQQHKTKRLTLFADEARHDKNEQECGEAVAKAEEDHCREGRPGPSDRKREPDVAGKSEDRCEEEEVVGCKAAARWRGALGKVVQPAR